MDSSRAKTLAALFLVIAALGAAMGRVGPKTTLDKKFSYSAATAASLLEDLGPAGRESYRRNEFLDLGFLLAYTAFAWVAVGGIWEKRLAPAALRRWRLIAFLPGVFDLVETSLIIRTLSSYPEGLERRLSWLCFFTPAKWSAAAVLSVFALYGALSPVPTTRGRTSPPGSSGPS